MFALWLKLNPLVKTLTEAENKSFVPSAKTSLGLVVKKNPFPASRILTTFPNQNPTGERMGMGSFLPRVDPDNYQGRGYKQIAPPELSNTQFY